LKNETENCRCLLGTIQFHVSALSFPPWRHISRHGDNRRGDTFPAMATKWQKGMFSIFQLVAFATNGVPGRP
jgi:hypothetical protein